MVFTPNKNLDQVAHGGAPNTWDVNENSNWSIVDNCFGATAVINLAAGNHILNVAETQCSFIVLTGALNANVFVTFPFIGGFYSIQNVTTNTSLHTINASIGAGELIGVPPGEIIDIYTDVASSAVGVKFRGLPHVGTYWDYSGSSVPSWVDACSRKPWLLCDGSGFNPATYPALNAIFPAAVLPDTRGRFRASLNLGTGRLTAAGGGLDGNTIFAADGVETRTIAQANLPNVNFPITEPNAGLGHSHVENAGQGTGAAVSAPQFQNNPAAIVATATNTAFSVTGITVNSGGAGTAFGIVDPSYIGGITMIRAG